MKRKVLNSLFIIVVMSLSVYLTAGAWAQTQSTSGLLTLYHLDSNGNPTVAIGNLFTSGEQIWVAVPQADSWAYWLTVYNDRGSQIWNQTSSSIPSNNLLPLVLSPSIFPPNHNYQVILRTFQGTLPGMGIAQSSATTFMVGPGLGRLLLESFSRAGGIDESHVRLVDMNGNPKAVVRLGLFLHQGGSSVQVTTELTDTHGRAILRLGEALASGSYSLEVRSVDGSTPSSPLRVSDFSVQVRPTMISAAQTTNGISATLLNSGGPYSIEGRLLLLERQLTDGNWTISASAYTDSAGQAAFPAPSGSGAWRVSFNGDIFYGPSTSNSTSPFLAPDTSPTSVQPAYSYASSPLAVTASTVIATTTSLYLPASAYATIPALLTAQVKDSSGIPVPSVTVWFYKDGGSIGTSVTNSTGFAAFVWTANVTGTHTMQAAFLGNTNYGGSVSAQQSFTINQTPTTIMILKPQTIAYSWDAFNYYSGNGRPIVVPIVTLALAAYNNSNPANVYIPPYNGNSTTPTHIAGYGWAGLNQSSAVTVSFNTTYTQTQSMNWTMNFYLPPCPTPPSCSSTTRTGHMYLSASLAPPSTLYTPASTTLNIPYQNVNTVSTASSQMGQDATPPANLYVNVNATYPYISLKMQGISVALEAYVAWLAYTLGGPTSSTTNCPHNGTCFNYYTLPLLSTTQGSDFAYACMSSGCSTPAANIALNLYNSKGTLCISTTTDNRGIAQLNFAGSKTCTYPYYYLGTPSTNVIVSELFAIEAVSKPYPFYTNFQGYNYAIYAPQRASRYLLSLHAYYSVSTYTVLYPGVSYPDVQPLYASCCDVFLTVQKHPISAGVSITPSTPTMSDKTNSTIHLTDLATNKAFAYSQANYNLARIDPNPTTVATGTLTTGSDGTSAISLGQLSYGNYTLIISRTGNATINSVSYSFNFTVYKARTSVIISPGWIQGVTVGQPYLFTTGLVDNETGTMIAVSGLQEQVLMNGAVFSRTWLCTVAGCSPGKYTIKVEFPKQSYYTETSITIMVSVAPRELVLSAVSSPLSPDAGQSVGWNVSAYDMINRAAVISLPINQYIDGVLWTTLSTDSSGTAVFTHTFSITSSGLHNVTFVSAQNNTYASARVQVSINVFLETSLSLQAPSSIILGQQNSFTVILKDASGSPLTTRTVQISINGVSYQNVTTDSNGNAQFSWRPDNTGSYTIKASFLASGSADSSYRSSSNSVSVAVLPQTTTNTQTTSGGTQSVSYTSAQGTPQSPPAGFSVSVGFPSLGWTNVNIQLYGRSVQGTLHVWNEFGLACVAHVFGACVMVAPWWHVHFDAASILMSFSFVTDFFTGDILSQSITTSNQWFVDQNASPFRVGQIAAQTLIGAAISAYTITRLASSPTIIEGGIDDSLAVGITAAVWLGGASAIGLGGFLAYPDKQSRLNYLGGMAAGFGLTLFLQLFPSPPPIGLVLNPVSWALWQTYFSMMKFANIYSRPALFVTALTVVLCTDEAFLLEGLM